MTIVDIYNDNKFIKKAKLTGDRVDLDSFPFQNKVVVIDPGHGGYDRWNIGYSGEYVEADGVLDISLRLKKYLEQHLIKVILTREEDKTLTLAERAEIANSNNADVFLSIHSDAAGDINAKGTTIFYDLFPEINRDKSWLLGKCIMAEYIPIMQTVNRGVNYKYNSKGNDDYYGILRESDVPSILIELCFHSNPEEEQRLLNPAHRNFMAKGIELGILKYFKIKGE